MKVTQGQKLIHYLRSHAAASYMQLMRAGAGSWPHKRISELECKGYRFAKRWSEDSPKYRLISLVGSPK